tara:strand:+ start:695 stop:943 length:249 start_codon:yes stop_codon:yes gene_type:complete
MIEDGDWIREYRSHSRLDELNRAIQSKKFYVTLPRKLGVEVDEYVKVTEEAYEKEWEYWEKQDGETPLGGPMGVTYRHKKDS